MATVIDTVYVEKELEAIAAMEAEFFERPYSLEDLLKWKKQNHILLLTATTNTQISGYLIASFSGDESELYRIAVLDAYRKQGIGSRLMNLYLHRCLHSAVNSVLLEVDERNTAALNFYTKLKFIQYSVRKDYYGTHDAYCLRRDLH